MQIIISQKTRYFKKDCKRLICLKMLSIREPKGKPCDHCSKLFSAERKYAHLSDAVRKTARQMEAEPLLESYWWWVNTLEPVPGSKLAEAVTHAKNQKEYLNAFWEYGEAELSNNFAENAIRPFTVGRKN